MMLSLDTDCLYASHYIPPINSPSYSNSVFRGFEVFFEVLISSNLLNMYMIINGDLNARTGKGEDFVNFQDNVPVLSEYGDILENDIGIKRCNNFVKHMDAILQMVGLVKTPIKVILHSSTKMDVVQLIISFCQKICLA